MESITNLIDELLDRKSYKVICRKCYDDDTYIDKHFYKDKVNERKLILLIQRSRWRFKLRSLLLDILFYIDEGSFTDKVIQTCINYHGKFRNTLLNQLSHIWLQEKQFEEIIKCSCIPEAYCKLFLIKICDRKNSIDDLILFVNKNKQYLKDLYLDTNYLISKGVSLERIRIAESLIHG